MRILKNNSIGLVIDVQEKLFPHMNDKDHLEINLVRFINGLQILNVPILITEQYTKGLGQTISSVQNALGNFLSIEKMSFSCCDQTDFTESLIDSGMKNVILCGIETHVCILQTTIDLLQSGYQPVVVEDCVSSPNLNDKNIAIKRMRQEGAVISSLESILFELTRESGTESFKAISKLIK